MHTRGPIHFDFVAWSEVSFKTLFARISLCLTLVLSTCASSHSQTVVVIQNNQRVIQGTAKQPAQELNKEYWAERVGFRIARTGDFELYSVLRGLTQASRNNPSVDAETLRSIGSTSLSYYDDPSKLPKFIGQDRAVDALTSMISMEYPYVGIASPIVMDMISDQLSHQIQELYPIDRNDMRFRYLTEGPDGLREMWDEAQTNPKLKKVIDDLISTRFKSKISMDDASGISPDPDFTTYKAAINALNNPAATPEDIAKAFKVFSANQDKKLEKINSEIKALNSKASTKERREAVLNDFRRQIDDQRATFYLAATAVGFFNPTLARTISAVGDAHLKLLEATVAYRQGQTSSLRMTADIVSAFFILVSMVQTSGPTADEIILDQLKALSVQMESFRQEMHARFDHVDQSLSRMYVDLIANFNELNKNISLARQGIIGVQVQLQNLQGQLGELDRRVQSYAQGLSSQVASENQTYCLGAQDVGDGKPLSLERFTACALSFATTGAVTAKNAVWTNQSTDFLDDSALIGNLNRPIEQNLNFLWALASARFDNRPAPYVAVANPVVWAANANEYMRLIARTKPIVTSMGPTDDFIRAGEEIQASIQAIGQSQSTRSGKETITLFDKLIPYVKSIYDRTALDVTSFEHEYQKSVMVGYDPWGGSEQEKNTSTKEKWVYTTAPGGAPLDYVPNVIPCFDSVKKFSGAVLPVPFGFAIFIPYTYRMAVELGSGKIEACYSNPRWAEHHRIPGTDTFSGRIGVDIIVTFTPQNTPSGKNLKPNAGSEARSQHSIKAQPTASSKRNGVNGSQPSREAEKSASPILVTHRVATGSAEWHYDCDARHYPSDGATNTALAIAGCVRWKDQGFNDDDLAEAIPSLWNGDKSLQGTFVSSASIEKVTPEEVSKNLETTKQIVEKSLQAHREQLRRDIVGTISSDAGSSDFVAEERLSLISDFRILTTFKELIDAYVGVVLSNTIDTDDRLASALGDLNPNNWAAEILREKGARVTTDKASLASSTVNRVLAPLAINVRFSRFRAVIDSHLVSGSEPYRLVETTLKELRAIRVLQVAQSLSRDHACFAVTTNITYDGPRTLPATAPKHQDDETLYEVRVEIAPKSTNSQMPLTTDVLIGNNQLLMDGTSEKITADGRNASTIVVPFPGNGMTFGQLNNGIIRICNDYGTDVGDWWADSITVQVSRGGSVFDTVRTWKDISFPRGTKVSVTLGKEISPAGPSLSTPNETRDP